MGSVQSSNGQRLYHYSFRHHRLPGSSSSQSQPLLENANQFMGVEHEVIQGYWENFLALEKEIDVLKSNFSRLETKLQKLQSESGSGSTSKAKATEGNKQEAITSLEQKVEKLKKSVDAVILGREAEKRINSAAMSKQGLAITNIEEKNFNLAKTFSELEIRVNEITSTMVEMAAAIAEMNDKSCKPEKAPESEEDGSEPYTKITVLESEIYGCFMILIFLVAVLIGINL